MNINAQLQKILLLTAILTMSFSFTIFSQDNYGVSKNCIDVPPDQPGVGDPWMEVDYTDDGLGKTFDDGKFLNANHVAAGISLRNKISGTIPLRGIPEPGGCNSKIMKAFLYFSIITPSNALTYNNNEKRVAKSQQKILFNTYELYAYVIANSDVPCWNTGKGGYTPYHITYKVDVTDFIPKCYPNQDYNLVLKFLENSISDGSSPWENDKNNLVRTEGASLIVIYENTLSANQVYLYDDNLEEVMFNNTAKFRLNTDEAAGSQEKVKLTMVGADGQRGRFGYPSKFKSNGQITYIENTSFERSLIAGNGATDQFAGPILSSSDWNGRDGSPLMQLWDTNSHLVNVLLNQAGQAELQYELCENCPNAGKFKDCVVPIAFVLELLRN